MNSDSEEYIDTSRTSRVCDAADEKCKELHKLCNSNRMWPDFPEEQATQCTEVLDWLEENKGNQKLLESAANYIDEGNMTPLDRLLSCSGAPVQKLVKRLLQLAPDTIKVKKFCGQLPLHMACDHWRLTSTSSDIINILLQAYPEAAEVQDDQGCLPLHYVCKSASFPELIKMLVEAYPGGARVQDKYGNLPLHIACKNNVIPNAIRMLREAYPISASVKNQIGLSPFDLACQASTGDRESLERLDLLLGAHAKSIQVEDKSNTNPLVLLTETWGRTYYCATDFFILHNAIMGKVSLRLVQLILEAFPKKCMDQDNRGMTPLQYASVSRAPHFFEYVAALLDASSSADGLTIPDKKGRTPLQLLKKKAYKKDKNKRLPLHRLAASSDSLNEKSLKLFLNAYPAGVTTADKYGLLPFHYACLNPASSVEVLWTFLNLCPEVIDYSGESVMKKRRKIHQKYCNKKRVKVT